MYSALLLLLLTYHLSITFAAECGDPTRTVPWFPSKTNIWDVSSGAPLLTHETANEVANLKYPSLENGWHQQFDCPHRTATGTLKRWSAASTWGDAGVPQIYSWVTIPENTRVLICAGDLPERLGLITIPASSELVFGDNEIDMSVTGIQVFGKMLLGGPKCRLKSKITITLRGKQSDKHATEFWHKGVVVEGTLAVHGARFFPTWTRLARTAEIGDNTLYLQDTVNWEKGQKVLITTTHLKDAADFHQNEVLTIEEVRQDPSRKHGIVRFIEPLTHRHYGGSEYQAEVGLLSRRIVIQGESKTSEPPEPTTCSKHPSSYAFSSHPCPESFLGGYGGHVRVQHSNAIANVRGVELYRMGKTNRLGQYPMHFHLLGDSGESSSFKDSSVHRSYFRCISIHGTNKATVSENVAFDVTGHCYYLEDGVEMYNKITYNLASHIHFLGFAPNGGQFLGKVVEDKDMILPADITASGFYITNSHNEFIGNAASGGFAGYAFPQLLKPIRGHSNVDMKPDQMPFIKFDGNSCHSSAWWWSQGGCFYVGGLLREIKQGDGSTKLEYEPGRQIASRDTRCAPGSRERCPLVFENTKVFLVSSWGMNNWGRRSDLIRYEAHDFNRMAGLLGNHYIHDAVAACRTKNVVELGDHFKTGHERRFANAQSDAFEWYDTNQAHIINKMTVRRCASVAEKRYAWSFLTHSSRFVPEFMQATKQIRYRESSSNDFKERMVRPTDRDTISVRMASWLDVDGTASRRWKPTLIGSSTKSAGDWWKLDDSCVPFSKKHMACDLKSPNRNNERTIGSLRVTHIKDQWNQRPGKNVCDHAGLPDYSCPALGYVTHFGRSAKNIEEHGMEISWQEKVTGPANGYGWYFWWKKGAPKRIDLKAILFQGPAADGQMLAFSYPSGTTFRVTYDARWCGNKGSTECFQELTLAKSLKEVQDGPGNLYYWNSQSKHLFIKVVAMPENKLTFDTEQRKSKFDKFEKGGIAIPIPHADNKISIQASCGGGSFGDYGYCSGVPSNVPQVNDCNGKPQYGIDDCVSGGNSREVVADDPNKVTTTDGTPVATAAAAAGGTVAALGVLVIYRRRRKSNGKVEEADVMDVFTGDDSDMEKARDPSNL